MYCSEGKYHWWLFRNGNGSTVFFFKCLALNTEHCTPKKEFYHWDITSLILVHTEIEFVITLFLLPMCRTYRHAPPCLTLLIHTFICLSWNKVFCSTGLNLTGLVIKIGLNSQSSVSAIACITHIWLPLWSSGFKMFLVTSLGNIPAFSTHVQCSKGLGEYLTISPWTLRYLSTCDLLTLVQIREQQHGMTQAIPCPLDLLTFSTSAVNTYYPFVQGLPGSSKGLHCLQAGRTRRVPAEQPLAGG